MKKLFVFWVIAVMAVGSVANAQEVDSTALSQNSSYIPDISLDTRFGYNQDITGKTGRFCGNGLFLDINGKIGRYFSYSLNHRLASFEGTDYPGFGNTNWLLLTFETEHFSVSAGKDALFVGSFEYDAYDLDSYADMNSLFWNCIDPWQWGVSAAWYPAEDQSLSFQFANSPFSTPETGNLFAYALAWRGCWDFYESYWTANLWQNGPKSYVGALNLGNRFYVGDFTVDLEYMTRAAAWGGLFKDDFTLLLSPSYSWEWGRAFVKCGWERVREDLFGYEYTGDNIFYGAGAEFFPLKSYKDIRLHAAWSSNSDYTGGHLLEIGLTWKLDLTSAGKKLVEKLKK